MASPKGIPRGGGKFFGIWQILNPLLKHDDTKARSNTKKNPSWQSQRGIPGNVFNIRTPRKNGKYSQPQIAYL